MKYLLITIIVVLNSCISTNKFAADKISTPNFCDAKKELLYRYDYFDQNGKQLFFSYVKKYNSAIWEFETEKTNSKIIDKIKVNIVPDETINTNQKKVRFNYLSNNEVVQWEMTGYLSNKDSIWFHPPRSFLFKILELNPFPFVKKPYKIGNKWEMGLKIGGDVWSDEKWKVWDHTIVNKIKYEIVDFKKEKTAFGDLDCIIVLGKAVSELGETELITYFNQEYGFVKLSYTNIDNSKINLYLIESENG